MGNCEEIQGRNPGKKSSGSSSVTRTLLFASSAWDHESLAGSTTYIGDAALETEDILEECVAVPFKSNLRLQLCGFQPSSHWDCLRVVRSKK